MRTKALLSVAAIAASAITAMAQGNVYSLNIVGYANVKIVAGNSFYANPFNHSGNNSASNIFTLAPLDDGGANPNNQMNSFYVLTFNGAGYDQVYYENDFTANNLGPGFAGWATDNSGSTAATPPILNPGKGFIINNAGPVYTNTFVGDVVPSPGTTNLFPIGGGNQLVGSVLPVAGNQTGLTSPLPAPLAPLDDGGANPNNYFNSFYVLTWNGAGFNQVYYENDFTVNNVGPGYAGWAVDAGPSAPASPPSIPIGVGYYINNAGPVKDWIQSVTNAP
jgi:hypothetical protein